MVSIEFYFDVSCPWCWVTSRWLTEVSTQRDIQIDWKPFSLTLKNDELHGDDSTGHQEQHVKAHKAMRMIEAINADKLANRADLYAAIGQAYYLDKNIPDDHLLETVLKNLDIDPAYLQQTENEAHDAALQQHLDDAIAIVGDDVGVPLIVFSNEQGEKQGYFGPVLQGLPEPEEGLKLWDGLVQLATSKHFFELKRGRTGGANPQSTARLF